MRASEAVPPADEDSLIALAQSGDRQAFAGLVELHWDRLQRWLLRLTRDSNRTDDLLQETFLKAFVAIPRLRPGSNFRAWLFRIAHNNWVNLRRNARMQQAPESMDLESTAIDPALESSQRETVERVYEGIRRLSPEFRAALLLRAEEGLSFKEIAEIVHTTEETARWRVFKARQKLLSDLEEGSVPPATRGESGGRR